MQVAGRDAAERIALEALGWLAGNDELLPVFLGSTGASLADLRAGATEPAFLASVLDFILMDDAWVLEAAAATDQPPESFRAARASLPGAEQVHWT